MSKSNKASEEATDSAVVATAETTSLSSSVAGTLKIDAEDIDIPRINVVQKMSKLDAAVGSIVLDKEHTLAEADQPLEAIVVAAQKGYREDIPFDNDEVPRIAWTKEQADLIAADSEYSMVEFAEITLLIKKPEECVDEAAFAFAIGSDDYAMGRINVSKNAYRTTYKRISTFAAFNSGVPLFGRVWTLKSEMMEKGKYQWYNPFLSITKDEADPSVVEFLKNFGA